MENGPEGLVQPAAGAAGADGAPADRDLLPRWHAGPEADYADDYASTDYPDDEYADDGGRLVHQPAADTGSWPADGSSVDEADQHADQSADDSGWRSMFHRADPDPPAQDPAGADTEPGARTGYQARHPRARRLHAARPQLRRPHLTRPNLARPHLRRPNGPPPVGTPPVGTPTAAPQTAAAQRAAAGTRQVSEPLVSRPLISPRLAANPLIRIWVTRIVVAFVLYVSFMLWHGWRLGLTVAVLWAAADIIYRSKTTAIVPPAIRVTSAQRSTRRRLKVLQPAGYLALNACTIPGKRPGTHSIIDHLVVGPAGVFSLNTERWDRRLQIRTIGGHLFHGPDDKEPRLEHSRWEASQAAALISAEFGRPVRVQPVMIVYGPKIPWVVNKLQGVDVFDGGRVGTYFRRQTKATANRHLDPARIAKIFAAAAAALPPIA